MSASTEVRTTLEALLAKQFLCEVATPEKFQQLRDPRFAEQIRQGLAPLGRTLSIVGGEEAPEAYFSGFVDLSNQQDREQVRKELLVMRDQISACIEFFRLVDQAGGNNLSLIAGGELPFAKLLDAIENHDTYLVQLRDLAGLKLFERSRNAKDTADRLMRVLNVMQEEGFLIRRQYESTVFVFTGKLSYLQQILGWLADYHNCAVDTATDHGNAASQGGFGI